MKEIVNIYKENRNFLESFIVSTLVNTEIKELNRSEADNFFKGFKSLDFVYTVDENWHQNSPSYFRTTENKSLIGSKKFYLSSKIKMNENGTFLSSPYINSYTGKLSITYVVKIDSGYLVFDFTLVSMLKRLKLLDANYSLQYLTKFAYGLMGFSLVVFAMFLALYAIATFMTSIFPIGNISLEVTFTSIIALTLGLAIFDLAKTILEQEVFSKSLYENKNEQNRVFSKFLISIVIALSIEALMVVFKVALLDYQDMIYAFYLIAGVALLILALGLYNYLSIGTYKRH